MEIRVITKEEAWDAALGAFPQVGFTQFWVWGEVLAREGKQVERLLVEESGHPVVAAQVVYVGLPFGWRYAFCPLGPVLSQTTEDHRGPLYDCLAAYLRGQGCAFARVEPRGQPPRALVSPSRDMNPRATMIIDLARTEDEIIDAMHPKTRYNIRLAQKKNLFVSKKKDIEAFFALMRETGKRDGFRLHEEKHYRAVLEESSVYQLTVYTRAEESALGKWDVPIATAVFIGAGDTFTYLYGASDYHHRALMAPYLLQWEGMKLGKQLGYSWYDFFGVAPKIKTAAGKDNYVYRKHHQYAGVTRFKQGFGGEYFERAGTSDLIIFPVKYNIYRILRFIRGLFR